MRVGTTLSVPAAVELTGVVPILEVPFAPDGEVDPTSFAHLVDHVLRSGVSAVMFPGFGSEFYKLERDEIDALSGLLLARRAAVRPGACVVLSVADHATEVAVRRAGHAVERGADALNLLLPSFLTPAPDVLRRHLEEVLSAAAPTPVVLQYAPAVTGAGLSPDVICEVAQQHTNLEYVKLEANPPGKLLARFRERAPQLRLLVGYGGTHMLDGLRRGAVGVQPGCSFVELYLEIWNCFRNGDLAGAEKMYARLLPYLSYWMQSVELIIAAEKMISVRRGLIAHSYCRRPGYELDHFEVEMIDRFCTDFASLLSGHDRPTEV